MSDVRYSYHKDSIDLGRVVTIARRLLENGVVQYGYTVCRPTKWIVAVDGKDVQQYIRIPGDDFSKKIGRDIARGRLDKDPYMVRPVGDEHPLDAIRRDFVDRVRNGERIPLFIQRSVLNVSNYPVAATSTTELRGNGSFLMAGASDQ